EARRCRSAAGPLNKVLELLALIAGTFDSAVQFRHEARLAVQDLLAGWGAVAGKNMDYVQLLRLSNHSRPIGDVSVGHVIVRAIHSGIAAAEHFFLGQIHKAIAARVRPTEKVEAHFTGIIAQN